MSPDTVGRQIPFWIFKWRQLWLFLNVVIIPIKTFRFPPTGNTFSLIIMICWCRFILIRDRRYASPFEIHATEIKCVGF